MSTESKSVDSNQNGSQADSNSVKLISSPNTEGADLNIHRFKELIVDELNKILKKEVPSENRPSKVVSIKNGPSKEVSIKNGPSENGTSENGPSESVSIESVTSEKKNILPQFKGLIVDELNKILKNVPSKEEKDIFLPKFKQLIVEELNKILPTINSQNLVVENSTKKPAKKLIVQENANINDKINYFIKTGAENKRKDADAQAKNPNGSGNPIIINTDYLEKNKKNAVYMLKDSNTLIGKYRYTIQEIDDAHNRRKSPATYNFEYNTEYNTVENLNKVTIASNTVLEKYNLINDKKIKYDTEYTTDVIRSKKNFDIKNEMVVLYKDKTEIDRGIIQSDDKSINDKSHITITINEKSYKLSSIRENMDTDVFTYFDSLRFIKSKAMQVPQDYIDSDFDNLKKMENNWGVIEQKMQFYSDIKLKNKIKLDERHKTKHGPQSYHVPIQGVPIYVDKNEWKKYIIKKDEKTAADAAVKTAADAAAVKAAADAAAEKAAADAAAVKAAAEKAAAENKKKADEEAENKRKEAEAENKRKEAEAENKKAEDAKYEKITNKINYNDGINYYFKDENGTYIKKNGKILSVNGNLMAKLNLNGNPSINCSKCYIKKDEKEAAEKAAAVKAANIDNPMLKKQVLRH
jgi:hypothetical protein